VRVPSDLVAYPCEPSGYGAGCGVPSQAATSPRGYPAVPSMVSPSLPGPLLLRPSRGPQCAHVPGARGRSANPSGPRPARRDAQPRRELGHGCLASGHGRPRVPIPGTVLSAWLGGGWTPKPMDYDDGPHGLEANGRRLRRRDEGRVMPRAGLEPATSRSSVSHSPKLSYRGSRGPSDLGGNSFSWTSAALLNRPRNHGSYPARAFPAVGEATRTRVHLPSARIAVPRGPRVGSNPAAPTVRECDRRG